MICGSRFYRRLYKPILLRINKFTWNKLYLEGSGNISALEALNASKPIILNDILHFLGPIGFEKIMSVSNKLINVLLGGSVVSYLVLNSILLFFMVIVLLGTGELMKVTISKGNQHPRSHYPKVLGSTPRFQYLFTFC